MRRRCRVCKLLWDDILRKYFKHEKQNILAAVQHSSSTVFVCCMQMLDFIYPKLGEVGWYEYQEPAALHQSNILIKCPLKSCNKNFSPRSIGKFVLNIPPGILNVG